MPSSPATTSCSSTRARAFHPEAHVDNDSVERREAIRAATRAARRAGSALGRVSGPERRAVLLAMADALERPDLRSAVLRANATDRAQAEEACAKGELARALV